MLHIDPEIFTTSPRNNSFFRAYGVNAVNGFTEYQRFSAEDAQMLEEQDFWVECSKSFWASSASPPGTLELGDTPMVLPITSAAPTGYPSNTQSCRDAPDVVEMSRNSSESSCTGERTLDVPFTPDSTGKHRKVVDQRCACSGYNHPFGNIHDRADHAKRICQIAWRCPEPECGKSYNRRDSFLRHQHTHKVDSYPCKICFREKKQKSFKRKDHLKEHVRKCHSGRGDNFIWSLRSPLNQSELDYSAFAVDVGMGTQKQQAVRTFVETLGYVLGDHDPKLDFGDLGDNITALSESDMKSVVGSMASVGATMAQTILSASTGLDHPSPERGPAL